MIRLIIVLLCLVPAFGCPTKFESELFRVVKGIAMEESRNDDSAFNEKEQAIGRLQIRPIMLRDFNINNKKQFKHTDCYNYEVSLEIFIWYSKHYSMNEDMNIVIRRWNGGPTGHRKTSTLKYLERVKAYLWVKENFYN